MDWIAGTVGESTGILGADRPYNVLPKTSEKVKRHAQSIGITILRTLEVMQKLTFARRLTANSPCNTVKLKKIRRGAYIFQMFFLGGLIIGQKYAFQNRLGLLLDGTVSVIFQCELALKICDSVTASRGLIFI